MPRREFVIHRLSEYLFKVLDEKLMSENPESMLTYTLAADILDVIEKAGIEYRPGIEGDERA